MRDSLIFYRSFYEAIKELPKENQWEIYNSIFSFGLDFKEEKLTWISKTIFTLIKPQLEANIKKYKNWKKSKTEAKQKQNRSKTQGNVNVNVNVKDNVKENVKDNVKDNVKIKYWTHVELSKTQYTVLTNKYDVNTIDLFIDKINDYCTRTKKSYTNYNLTIQNWIRKDEKDNPKQHQQNFTDLELFNQSFVNNKWDIELKNKRWLEKFFKIKKERLAKDFINNNK